MSPISHKRKRDRNLLGLNLCICGGTGLCFLSLFISHCATIRLACKFLNSLFFYEKASLSRTMLRDEKSKCCGREQAQALPRSGQSLIDSRLAQHLYTACERSQIHCPWPTSHKKIKRPKELTVGQDNRI